MLGGGEQRRLRRGTYGSGFAQAPAMTANTDFNIF